MGTEGLLLLLDTHHKRDLATELLHDLLGAAAVVLDHFDSHVRPVQLRKKKEKKWRWAVSCGQYRWRTA